MAGRERTTTISCAEQDCGETKFHIYTSRREYTEIWREQNQRPWKCTRHDKPEQVLRPDNTTTTHVYVASRVRCSGYERDLAQYQAAVARRSNFAREPKEFLDGLFWLPEGEGHGSGFTYGPGFKAHASDFPEGTRLVITDAIERGHLLHADDVPSQRPIDHAVHGYCYLTDDCQISYAPPPIDRGDRIDHGGYWDNENGAA